MRRSDLRMHFVSNKFRLESWSCHLSVLHVPAEVTTLFESQFSHL